MSDRLVAVMPDAPPQGVPGASGTIGPATTVDDLTRILALPRRPPVNCERNPLTERYAPATQALIEVVTARYARPKRVSCACMPRKVTAASDGRIFITREMEGESPAPPISTTVAAFVADNRASAVEIETARQVQQLKPGVILDLPAASGRGHPCIEVLNAPQAWFLYEGEQYGASVAFLGVGSGKSLCFILAPLMFPGANMAVLCIEPKQRFHYRAHYLRIREHFRVPTIVFDDGVSGYIVPGTTPLRLISYSVLSRPANSEILDQLKPQVLLLDEAHRACGQSAINRRVKRYAADSIRRREEAIARGEPVRARALHLLPGSGTLEVKSVEDTQMLCAYSLGTGSPLPIDPNEASAWSKVMDVSRRPDRDSRTAVALHTAFGNGPPEKVSNEFLIVSEPERPLRKGFGKHRMYTPGIITASAEELPASLYISERKPPKMPQAIVDALAEIRTNAKRPDGDILVEKLDQVICARNVACGFYTYWAFPKHPCICLKEDIGPRCDRCLLIDDWYAKRKAYNKALRSKLLEGQVNLDSPKLCEQAAERFWQEPAYEGRLPVWECEEWPPWRDIMDKVEHEEKVKWIDDWLARDAAKWATDNKGVVWFSSIAFGRKVAELAGIPYFNGGPGAEERMAKEKGDRSIVVSIPAHGAGTDGLQHIFFEQLVCETPASNANSRGYEQLFGRLHRKHQKADVVKSAIYLHVSELWSAFESALRQSEFNADMTPNKYKLRFADIDIAGLGE